VTSFVTSEVRCSACGRVHCTRREFADGRHSVEVAVGMVMRAVDVARSVFDLICPDCGCADRVRLAFDAPPGPHPLPRTRRLRRSGGKQAETVGSRGVDGDSGSGRKHRRGRT
jgi:hypothetical protein